MHVPRAVSFADCCSAKLKRRLRLGVQGVESAGDSERDRGFIGNQRELRLGVQGVESAGYSGSRS